MSTHPSLLPFVLALAGLALVPLRTHAHPRQQPVVDPARELMITDLGIVDDPVRTAADGAWHFGTLMSRLAGNVAPEEFVAHWLDTLIQPQIVNGVPILETDKALAFQAFRDAWLAGGSALDVKNAPFRLLAIVNRPDLVRIDTQGVHAFGELRFVFGAHWPGAPTETRNFLVIFEFGVPSSSCTEVQQWAQRWHDLGKYEPGTRAYNISLQSITDEITLPDPTNGRPNGSLLNQLRTNEFELTVDSLFWNLREWNIVAPVDLDLGQLESVTTKQTPHFSYVATAPGRAMLREFLDQNRAPILAGNHVIPDFFLSPTAGLQSFQTGDAVNASLHTLPHGGIDCCSGTFWWAPGYRGLPQQPDMTVEDALVRHGFALQTCSGCHFNETGTPFTMVSHRQAGQVSGLSPFLTGVTIPDAVAPQALDVPGGTLVPVQHSFDDLARRKSILKRMLLMQCTPPPGEATAEETLQAIQSELGTRVH